MGWSDNVDERISELNARVNWLMGHHARLLVGRRLRVPSTRVRVGHGWSSDAYEWVDGPGTVTQADYGTLTVRLDSGHTVTVDCHEAQLLEEETKGS